jgi:hypothetical protein
MKEMKVYQGNEPELGILKFLFLSLYKLVLTSLFFSQPVADTGSQTHSEIQFLLQWQSKEMLSKQDMLHLERRLGRRIWGSSGPAPSFQMMKLMNTGKGHCPIPSLPLTGS